MAATKLTTKDALTLGRTVEGVRNAIAYARVRGWEDATIRRVAIEAVKPSARKARTVLVEEAFEAANAMPAAERNAMLARFDLNVRAIRNTARERR